ncbi:MAG: M23 family metallopeptidase [Candidatus Omnitrophota bacterium]
MKRIKQVVLIVVFTGLAAFLYRPASIFIFHIAEPKFLCPLDLNGGIKIRSDSFGTGEFGAKRNGGRLHLGVDIEGPIGTPVRAAKSGRAFPKKSAGMGRYIVIKHPDNSTTIYGHLSKVFVMSNQKVRRADIIGEVGKTGNAWNPSMVSHLHFEIRIDDEPVNPLAGYMQTAK